MSPDVQAQPETQLQVTHASGLHAVSRLLAEMHREMLRTSGVTGSAVRLSVVNVVAVCVDAAGDELAVAAVARIAAKHPARAIVVVADIDAPTSIEADLSLQCVPYGDGQICTEQVRLSVCGEPALHLASVVTPLLVPDIPVQLWLAGAPPMHQAFGQDAVAICERMIIDSGAYPDPGPTLAALAAELDSAGDAVFLSDVTWERLRPWRQTIANAFDGSEMRPFLRRIERVVITASGATVPAQAWMFAGWLGSRLGWDSDVPILEVTASPLPAIEEGDLASVIIECRGEPPATVTLERREGALHAVIDAGSMRAERALRFEHIDTVDLVSALLEHAAEEPTYRPALARAAALAEAAP